MFPQEHKIGRDLLEKSLILTIVNARLGPVEIPTQQKQEVEARDRRVRDLNALQL